MLVVRAQQVVDGELAAGEERPLVEEEPLVRSSPLHQLDSGSGVNFDLPWPVEIEPVMQHLAVITAVRDG